MIEAVIFDLDGVIVSTDQYHYQAWKKMADLEGIYFDEKINHRLRGVSRIESLEIILERADKTYNKEEKHNLATYKNEVYVNLLAYISKKDILPYVEEVLMSLKEKGVKIAIGSSSKNAKAILNYIGLYDAFDVIADGNDIKHSKPAPDIFLVASKRLGVAPEKCMVVEDAIAGIIAAKKAGMMGVAIGDAKHSDLADVKINDLREILTFV